MRYWLSNGWRDHGAKVRRVQAQVSLFSAKLTTREQAQIRIKLEIRFGNGGTMMTVVKCKFLEGVVYK